MNPLARPRIHNWALALAFLAWVGCQTTPEEPPSDPRTVKVESIWVEDGHPLGACLKEYGQSLADLPDGVLFFDRDSRIRVTPPRGGGVESYHVHLLHRVAAGELVDRELRQGTNGLIEVDLARFDRPEVLVVTSSAFHVTGRVPVSSPPGTRREEALIPPYAVSFRLVPSDQAELVMSLQNFRREIKTEGGTLFLFVQAFNRRDMLISWVDPTKSLGILFREDPYVYLPSQDGYVPPRLLVDVLHPKGSLWQRSGTWPIPEGIGRAAKSDAPPFVFRTPRRDLIAFTPPPCVDLTLPEEPPATSARIEAAFSGLRAKDGLHLVLATAYPVSMKRSDYAVRVQSHEVEADTKTGSYVADLSQLDSSKFPLTSAVLHRFVQPWVLHGGMYRPVPPLGTSTVRPSEKGDLPRLHARVLAPKYASHYDWLHFMGDSRGSARKDSSLWEEYSREKGPDDGPSPNIPPPPYEPPTDGGVPPPPIVPPGGDRPGTGSGGFPGGGGSDQGGGGQPAMGHITINLSCPFKPPLDCGEDSANCKCPPHLWTMSDLMGIMTPAFPGACDFSWFGLHGDMSPCCKTEPAGILRVSYWGVNFQIHQVWYQVSVHFGPCVKRKGEPPPPPPPPQPPEKPKEDPPNPLGGPEPGGVGPGIRTLPALTIQEGSSLGNLDVVEGFPATLLPASTSPQVDPNLSVLAVRIVSALDLPMVGGSTYALPVELYNPDVFSIALNIRRQDTEDFLNAYYGRPQSSLNDTLDMLDSRPQLDLFVQGIIRAIAGGGGPIVPPPGCGSLGIEFVALLGLVRLFKRRRV